MLKKHFYILNSKILEWFRPVGLVSIALCLGCFLYGWIIEPDFADRLAKTNRFTLQLSGHSHGGQVNIPVLGPLVLPVGDRKYSAGLNQVRDFLEYTNRGVGMTSIPIRFNCRPEITVFTLNTIN